LYVFAGCLLLVFVLCLFKFSQFLRLQKLDALLLPLSQSAGESSQHAPVSLTPVASHACSKLGIAFRCLDHLRRRRRRCLVILVIAVLRSYIWQRPQVLALRKRAIGTPIQPPLAF
jgi:hypothetical protein